MNRIEHYHDWLRDAHATEKQAESTLRSMVSRTDNYLELHARVEQHLSETKNQIVQLETILDHNNISRSVTKDSMSKVATLGQSISGIFPSDEIVEGSISGYAFEQSETVYYTSLLTIAEDVGDTASVPVIEVILNEEKHMVDWLIQYIPQTTEKFLIRSETDDVEVKK